MKLKLNSYINKQSNYLLIKWSIKQSIEQLIQQLNNWKNIDGGGVHDGCGNDKGGGDGNCGGSDYFFGPIIKWYRISRERIVSWKHATIVSIPICIHNLLGRQFIVPAKLVFVGVPIPCSCVIPFFVVPTKLAFVGLPILCSRLISFFLFLPN